MHPPATPFSPRHVFPWAVVLIFYGALALLAVYMPLFHLDTHLPGNPTTDYYHFHWNFWWLRHALTNGLPIYETAHVLAPFTSNLSYHTLTPFWFPLWAALEPLAGTVTAMTAVFIAAFTLNGLFFHLLLHNERVNHGLALVGGAMLALSPIFFTALYWTNINLMNWFWIPALLLIWRQVIAAPTQRAALTWAGILAVSLWAMVLSDLQYPLFAGFVVVPYGLWTLWQADASTRLRAVGCGIGAVMGALALLWIVGPLPYLLEYDTGTLNPTPVENAIAVDMPDGYLWRTDPGGDDVSFGGVFIPLLIVALAVRAWNGPTSTPDDRRFMPPAFFWLAVSAPPLWLAAGPQLPVFYDLLHDLLGGTFRYPERFVPVALIPGLLFALRALTPLTQRGHIWRYGLPVTLLLAVFAAGRSLHPQAIQPQLPNYSIYQQMGADDLDYVVVEVPTGASSGTGIVGESPYSELQWYGLMHGKRMVNGHFSRVDVTHYWYMRTDDPLFAWLGQRRFLEPDLVEPRLAEIVSDYPVGYITVHTDLIRRYTGIATVQEVIGYLNSLPHLLCPPAIEGDLVAFRTTWHPAGCDRRTPPQTAPGVYQIDLGAPGDARYLGWGWHFAEEIIPGLTARWTGAPHATDPTASHTLIYADLPPGGYDLTLHVQAFGADRPTTVRVNGEHITTVTVPAADLTEITVRVPADRIGDGQQVTLSIDGGVPGSAGERDLGLMVDWVRWAAVD